MLRGRKKILSIAMAAVLLLPMLLSSCGSEPPLLEDVKEEFSTLIASSAKINEFLFGEGLPVYARDGSEEEKSVYESTPEALAGYEMVREDSPYLDIEQMKAAAEQVYTSDYLESAYLMAFDGYADDIGGVATAKYLEWDGWLYKNMNYEPLIDEVRSFDYETMKIVKPSNGEYVNISIESSLGGEKLTVTLAFSLTKDGWRLDTPTY